MTERERQEIAQPLPDCGYRGLSGPRGGAAINVECGNLIAGPVRPRLVGTRVAERIPRQSRRPDWGQGSVPGLALTGAVKSAGAITLGVKALNA
jgi:hypothetical protein